MIFLFNWVIFRLHVNFQGSRNYKQMMPLGKYSSKSPELLGKQEEHCPIFLWNKKLPESCSEKLCDFSSCRFCRCIFTPLLKQNTGGSESYWHHYGYSTYLPPPQKVPETRKNGWIAGPFKGEWCLITPLVSPLFSGGNSLEGHDHSTQA